MRGPSPRQVVAKHATAASLMGDRALLGAVPLWAWRARDENMGLERLLASTCKAVGSRFLTAERAITPGFLVQWLQQHRQAGGADPRSVTRAHSLQHQVPLQASRRRMKRGRHAAIVRPWMLFVLQALRGQRGMSCAALHRRRRVVAAAYRALSSAERAVYEAVAARANSARRLRGANDISPLSVQQQKVEAYKQRIGHRLWGMSSQEQPLRPEVLEQRVSANLPENKFGMTSALDGVRGESSTAWSSMTEVRQSSPAVGVSFAHRSVPGEER